MLCLLMQLKAKWLMQTLEEYHLYNTYLNWSNLVDLFICFSIFHKPVVPVHVFTGPVFSYNKTNVICHIHYFNPRNKVYIRNIYISKLRREVCSFYLANFPWLSKELLPVNSLSCLCKEKCHSIHMFHYV